jgi:YebC/PmpR family DNA-binding regulatory protein
MSQSEWSKIKVYKGPADAKRSAVFTRMARLITIAAREGGGDQNFNFKLRSAIERALDANMPKDSIERAVKKGTGEIVAEKIEETLYEGYGPGGVAVLVEALTDNRHRTSANIKHAFSVHGGNMAATGAVQWMFERRGIVTLKETTLAEEDELALIDAGVMEIAAQDGSLRLICAPDAVGKVRIAAENLGMHAASMAFEWVAKDKVPELHAKTRASIEELFKALDEDEDVSGIFSNLV